MMMVSRARLPVFRRGRVVMAAGIIVLVIIRRHDSRLVRAMLVGVSHFLQFRHGTHREPGEDAEQEQPCQNTAEHDPD